MTCLCFQVRIVFDVWRSKDSRSQTQLISKQQHMVRWTIILHSEYRGTETMFLGSTPTPLRQKGFCPPSPRVRKGDQWICRCLYVHPGLTSASGVGWKFLYFWDQNAVPRLRWGTPRATLDWYYITSYMKVNSISKWNIRLMNSLTWFP